MTSPPIRHQADYQVDVALVGGGIAGLWLANRLHQAGYRIALFEADKLGGAQTLSSQGIIHGGLKYALGGRLNSASEAIAAMPSRWSACLSGNDPVDLSGLKPLASHYYLFSNATTRGMLTSFFASKALHGRITKLMPAEFPTAFQDPAFNGIVYQTTDFVLNTKEILQRLASPIQSYLYRHEITPDHCSIHGAEGVTIRLDRHLLRARKLILCAGSGNDQWLHALKRPAPEMQRRPLHQVIVRAPNLPPLFAHCLTQLKGAEPRLTITSHQDAEGRWLWYLGGQLATQGISLSETEQFAKAKAELQNCVPWLPWHDARFESLRIDRAEPKQTDQRRPDEAYVSSHGPVLVVWPTKLTLAPDLGDRVMALFSTSVPSDHSPACLPLPPAELGDEPWLQFNAAGPAP